MIRGGSGGFHKADDDAHTFLRDKPNAIDAETQADFIVSSRITCLLWMDNPQKHLSSDAHTYAIPIFDYNQLLALCLDAGPPEHLAAISTVDHAPQLARILG